MSLHFFCDQCIPAEIIELFKSGGHKVTCLRDVLPIRAVDALVITKAQELKAILVSLNGDFSDIVTYAPNDYLGIFAIQLHNHPEVIPQLMDRLLSSLNDELSPDFYAGKLLIIESHRIRIRH